MDLQLGASLPDDFWAMPAPGQRGHLGALVDAGVAHVFSEDHLSFLDGRGVDALVALAVVAGLEPRLDLETCVLQLALRHPMLVARQIGALAEAAPGRLTIGVGIGGEDRDEIEVAGIDASTRGARTNTSLRLVRRLLEGQSVDGDGTFYTFKGGTILPAPSQRVPFVIGGRSDAAMRRCAAIGDGWIPQWCSVRSFARGVERVEELGGRRNIRWRHGLHVWAGLGADPAEGRRHVARRVETRYGLGFDVFERYCPVGTAEQIATGLAPFIDAGATRLNVRVCGADREQEVEALGAIRSLLARRD